MLPVSARIDQKLSPALRRSSKEALKLLQTGSRAADVANALEVPEGQLLYILYKRDPSEHYCQFFIPKRSGGRREIMMPTSSMSILQKKLLGIISPTYKPPSWVHGFVRGKGIVTNAEKHTRRRFVLNIDLKDFYDQINFGRVRGVLQCPPFRLHEKIAAVLAQIVTHDNKLPQGACTSPMISNLVAWPLDRKLISLARKYKLTYSRYADDITFSTSRRSVSSNVVRWSEPNPILGNVSVGKALRGAIENAGFLINENKVRVQIPGTRQEVTGLTVNEFPNVQRSRIRNIRALLHSWRTRGLLEAEIHHIKNHAKKPPMTPKGSLDGTYFKQVVYGHMAFIKQVRGDDDRIYLKFCSDIALLDSSPPKFIRQGKEKLDMYDFFICHASEDKESIARPLSDSLKSKGAKVFIDEVYIQLGDSFVQRINHALGRSRHIVAVISSNSYRKHWPATELRSVLAMEATEGNKLLPIMVGNNTEVERFLQELPLLSHRLYHQWDPATDSSENVQKAIDELLRVWSPPGTERD